MTDDFWMGFLTGSLSCILIGIYIAVGPTNRKKFHSVISMIVVGSGKAIYKFVIAIVKVLERIANRGEKDNKPITKEIRERVWRKYNRGFRGRCFVCKDSLDHSKFHIGHVKSRANRGLNKIGNLRPICSSCNLGMGGTNLYDYKRKYYGRW